MPVQCVETFTEENQFLLPENNGQISFGVSGSYEFAAHENGTWNFAGLALDNYVLNLTERAGVATGLGVLYGRDVLDYCPNDGNFSVSVQNSNIKITNYDVVTQYYPYSGWFNYTVVGSGVQTFNLHYLQPISGWTGPDLWTVYIDGVSKPQNDSWSISGPEQIITISGATNNVAIFFDSAPMPRDPIHFNPNPIPLIFFGISIAILAILAIGFLLYNHKRKRNHPQSHLKELEAN